MEKLLLFRAELTLKQEVKRVIFSIQTPPTEHILRPSHPFSSPHQKAQILIKQSLSLSLHLTPTFLSTSSQNDSVPIPFPLISLITLTKRHGQLRSIAIEF